MRSEERRSRSSVVGSEMTWLRNWSPSQFLGPMKPLIYAPTDVGPLWYSRLVAAPALFTRLPRRRRIGSHTARSGRPARTSSRCAIDGIRLTMGTEVTAADPIGDGVRLTLTDGTQREVDHLMFGTGYKVDVTRYPFLSEGHPVRAARRRRLSRVDPWIRDVCAASAHAGGTRCSQLRADAPVRLRQLVRRNATRERPGAGEAASAQRIPAPAAPKQPGGLTHRP